MGGKRFFIYSPGSKSCVSSYSSQIVPAPTMGQKPGCVLPLLSLCTFGHLGVFMPTPCVTLSLCSFLTALPPRSGAEGVSGSILPFFFFFL